ncbi:MAG: SIS domain-containing protein [Clostridiales bacterium]|nr:SIS domain-containing protein [Clostridiales bacterium]
MTANENLMQMYYAMQPDALRETANQAETILSGIEKALEGLHPEKVFLLGIGSSFHSARLAELEFRTLSGLPVESVTPETAEVRLQEMNPQTLVLAVSQSGTSTNTLAAVKQIKAQRGCPVFTVTQGLSSPLAAESDAIIPLCIPDEKAGPKTMGVVATVCSLLLAAAAIRRDRKACEDLIKDFRAEADAMEANIPAARDWALSLKDQLSAESAWMVVGQRAAFAPAGECALKLIETVRRIVTCLELEEAVHGPAASFISKPALMVLHLPWEDAVRPEALCGSCEARGGHAYRIGLDTSAPHGEAGSITLSYHCRRLSLLELLLPSQAVSAWIAPRMGIDLDRHDSDSFSRIFSGHLDG